MKNVEIILENKEILLLQDDDDTPIEEYSEKLSSLFQVSNITTLIIGDKSLLIRPSKIFAIKVNSTEIPIINNSNLDDDPDLNLKGPEPSYISYNFV